MRIRILLFASLACLILVTGANAGFISTTYTGNVGMAVASYPDAFDPGPGVLTLSGIPTGATIVNATLFTDNYFGEPLQTATFAGTSLGAGTVFASDGGLDNLSEYDWNVTGLVTGNGSYHADYSGFANTYGLSLMVVYSSPSASANGQVQVLLGANDVCGASPCSVTDQFTGFGAGSGTLFIRTGADDDAQSGETINLNGTTVGGPIDQNLGAYASLFQIGVSNIDTGTNSININSPYGDEFDWQLAALYGPGPVATGTPEPATFGMIGAGLTCLVLWRRRQYPK